MVRHADDDYVYPQFLCICQLDCIGVHVSCYLNQSKSLIPHLLAMPAAHLALDLGVPFESWCDKYWMLRVNTLQATCLPEYIDGGIH